MISDVQYLRINPECIQNDECEVCARIDIVYVDEEKNISINFGNVPLSDFCYKFTQSGCIQKLINSEAVINNSFINSIGFEWNQFFEGILKDTEVDQYHCWSSCHKQVEPCFNSWLYNDENGNVIFEITPFYPWHGKTKKTNPEKISYKEWIKTYKPILKTMIPKDSLKQWIVQAKELEKIYFPEFQKL